MTAPACTVLGTALLACSYDLLTDFYRDSCGKIGCYWLAH